MCLATLFLLAILSLTPYSADGRCILETNIRHPVFTGLAKPAGSYSYGVVAGNLYYLTAQSGRRHEEGAPTDTVQGDIEVQTRQALRNIGTVLSAANLDYKNVVKTTLYLKDIKDIKKVDEVYREFFQKPYPARTTVQVADLPLKGNLIEIESVAVIPRRTCWASQHVIG